MSEEQQEVLEQTAEEPTFDDRFNEAVKALEEPVEETTEETQPETQTQEEKPVESDLRPVEKEIAKREEERKLREYEEQLAQYRYKEEEWKQLEAVKQQSKLEFLKKAGINLDDLTKEILNQEDPKERTADDVYAELERYKKQLHEQTVYQQQEALRQSVRNQISQYVDQKAEDFPVVGKLQLQDVVFEKIAESAHTARNDSELMTVEQATKAVNEDFRQLYDTLHEIFGNKPASMPMQTPRPKTNNVATNVTNTLTNQMDANSINPDEPEDPVEAFNRRLKMAEKLFEQGGN